MNSQTSLILSVEGKKVQRKEMSRIANVANMVINHRSGLPKELYSWQGQVLANMLMGVLADYSLGQRNSSC